MVANVGQKPNEGVKAGHFTITFSVGWHEERYSQGAEWTIVRTRLRYHGTRFEPKPTSCSSWPPCCAVARPALSKVFLQVDSVLIIEPAFIFSSTFTFMR